MSTERYVSRDEIAFLLGVESRTITNYVKQHPDFPSRMSGASRTFPVQKCLQWQRDRVVADAVASMAPEAPDSFTDAELRKAIADAEFAEIKVAKLRSELVDASVVGTEVSRAFDRVAAQLKAKPGEYAPQILQPLTMPEAVAILRRLVSTSLAALQIEFNRDNVADRDDDAEAPAA